MQILTDANELLAEAIRDAAAVTFGDVPTRVFRAEHLVAVALQTGRRKDYLRASIFVELGAVSAERLLDVLKRHGLVERFESLRLAISDGQG